MRPSSALGEELFMLRPSGAEQIDEKGRQRQVERSRFAALGLRNVQDACVNSLRQCFDLQGVRASAPVFPPPLLQMQRR